MKTAHLNQRLLPRSTRRSPLNAKNRRRDAIVPAFEPLEQRRMLAAVTVSNALDVVNGNTSSIANLIANPGADGISLREAIIAANNTAGADTINFAAALAGQTITLGGTALPQITDHLTINGATNLTVQPVLTHVVDVAPSVIAQVNNLTFLGGFRAGNGGAIANRGLLRLTNVSVRNSVAVAAHGGGIYNHSGAELQLHHSSVTNNIAQFGHGGGVYNLGELVVTHSTISGNSASGGQGGGIHNTGRAIVFDTTIADNQAVGTTTAAQGGGVYNNSPLDGISLQRVTLLGNKAIGGNGANGTNGSNGANGFINALGQLVQPGNGNPGDLGGTGRDAQGGGLFSLFGALALTDSTIDSNIAQGGNGGNGGTGGTGGIGTPGYRVINVGHDGGVGANGGQGGSGGTGGAASGGGLYIGNYTNQTYTWSGLRITGNEAIGGNGGKGGTGGTGGAGGRGIDGHVDTFGAWSVPSRGGNGGNGGPSGASNAAGAATGGGLVHLAPFSGTLNVRDATIAGNRAVAGDGGDGAIAGNGGNGGAGGNGVAANPASINGANGGRGGDAFRGGSGYRGESVQGGGVGKSGGTLNLLNTTIASNQITGGDGGEVGPAGLPGQGGAGGVAAPGGTNGTAGGQGSTTGAVPLVGSGGHGYGGGIHVSRPSDVDTTANLRNVTVASNLVTGGDAGTQGIPIEASSSALGGGLYISGVTTTLNHVTVSGNHVRAGISLGMGNDVAGGGGALILAFSTLLNHTIVAGNLAGPGAGSPNNLVTTPVAADSAFNLIGAGQTGGLTHGVNGNLVGIANPMLGPLADNGGSTPTMRPLLGSPAIDAGDRFFQPSGDLLLDQRGRPRVMRGAAQTQTNDVVGLAEIKFGTTGGQLVTPVNAFASTYWGPSQTAANLINNSGLDTSSGNVMTYTHAPSPNAFGMWAAGNGQGGGGTGPVVADQYIVLDLGANHNLSQAYLWQMVQTNLIGRGIKEFRLYGSTSAPNPADAANPPAVYNLSGYNLLLDTTMLAPGPQSGPSTAQAFALTGASNVRTIYLDVLSSYNTGPRIDIGAVEANRYFVANSAEFIVDAPQPSVRFTLSELIDPASVSPSDVVVERYTTIHHPGGFVHASGLSVDGVAITFTLPVNMIDGPHRATLPAGSVTDTLGNPLSVDLSFDFFVLAGDANGDRSVNIADFAIVAANFNQPGTFSQGDFNYSGTVEIGDFAILASKFNTSWPAPFARPGVVSDGARGSASTTVGHAAPVRLATAEPSPFSQSRAIEGVIGLID